MRKRQTQHDPNKRLERDPRNFDGDGISAHKGGLGNHGPNWISNNSGKLVLGGAAIAIILMVAAALTNAGE